MQIFPLSEGIFTVDSSKQFIPFLPEKDSLSDRPKGSLLVEIQPFLVKTNRDLILLDTGLGFLKNGKHQLYQQLEQNHFSPDQITKILLSHLHLDHIGGSVLSEHNRPKLAFPSATYYIQKQELEYALQSEGKSYPKALVDVFIKNPQVCLVDGAGTIDGYIHYALTGGHSAYHQVFWITEGEDIVFYGGDEAPQLNQLKHKFIAKYDFDGKKAAAYRENWKKEGAEKNWKFLFYHDIAMPIFSFEA